MVSTTEKLLALIDFMPRLEALSEEEYSARPAPGKWSKKEVIGHLIDSAQNNIRRFIVAQYEDDPAISYNQDKWVSINNYQEQKAEDLIRLWFLLNKQVIAILENTSRETMQRTCQGNPPRTIEWLADDYFIHLQHHIHQVLDLEAISYP